MGKFFRIMKWVVGATLLVVLVLGGAALMLFPTIQKRIQEARNQGSGAMVRLEPVGAGRLVRTISAPGLIEATRRVSISARISAQIIALPFEEGDVVKPGDVVVKLDDRDLQAQLSSAEASLRAEEARLLGARASYVNAVSEWERQQALFQSADVSKSAMEAAEAEKNRSESALRAAEAGIEMAKANITRVREDLRYTEIVSPIHGTVTRVNAEVGELVVTGTMNNAGTVILEIADLDEMIVVAEVDESDVAQVRVGQNAKIYVNAYSDDVFDGHVKKIALERRSPVSQRPRATTNSDVFEVEVLLDLNGRQILSGLTASVDIEVETIEDVMLAPSQAIKDVRIDELPIELTRDNPLFNREKTFATVVFTMVDGEAVATPVVTGASDLRTTAIRQGIEPGAKIIVGPYKALLSMTHGTKVQDEEAVKAAEEARKAAATAAKDEKKDDDGAPEAETDSNADADNAAAETSGADGSTQTASGGGSGAS